MSCTGYSPLSLTNPLLFRPHNVLPLRCHDPHLLLPPFPPPLQSISARTCPPSIKSGVGITAIDGILLGTKYFIDLSHVVGHAYPDGEDTQDVVAVVWANFRCFVLGLCRHLFKGADDAGCCEFGASVEACMESVRCAIRGPRERLRRGITRRAFILSWVGAGAPTRHESPTSHHISYSPSSGLKGRAPHRLDQRDCRYFAGLE